jgi:uncharacterized membrane protein YfcA
MTALIVAAILSVAIGVALGVLGGGGSILTVPILIYALGVEEKSAIASSLLVVGVTSAAAAFQHARAKNVVWPVAVVFAATAMAGAYFGGRVSVFIPSRALLVLFALMMLATAVAMWRGRRSLSRTSPPERTTTRALRSLPFATIALEGLLVGAVTGLVGAGGGFLVVPALVLFAGLSMRQAVGTSLVVIAVKSFAGYAGYAHHVDIDWTLTATVAVAAVFGSIVGAPFATRVPDRVLKKGFAVFVVATAVFILIQQL